MLVRNHLDIINLIALIFLFIFNYYAYSVEQDKDIPVIVIDGESHRTRLLTKDDVTARNIAKLNIIYELKEYYFNFNSENYEDRLGYASRFFTKSVYEQEEKFIIDLIKKSRNSYFSEKSKLFKIDVDDNNSDYWTITLKINIKHNGLSRSVKKSFRVHFIKVSWDKSYRWGYKIDELQRI